MSYSIKGSQVHRITNKTASNLLPATAAVKQISPITVRHPLFYGNYGNNTREVTNNQTALMTN